MGEWLRWRSGRQGSGYRKLLLARWGRKVARGFLGFDVWLLDYPPGASIPPHVDPVPGARHYRANLALATGGTRMRGDALLRIGDRFVLFRPDVVLHEVQPCARRRVVLSVGWAVR